MPAGWSTCTRDVVTPPISAPEASGRVQLETADRQWRKAVDAWLGGKAAWYPKTRPAFADALILVRITLWTGKPPLSGPGAPPTRNASGSSSPTPAESHRSRES